MSSSHVSAARPRLRALLSTAFLAAMAWSITACTSAGAIDAFKQSSAGLMGRLAEAASRGARYDGYEDTVFVPADEEGKIAGELARYRAGVAAAVGAQGEEAIFDANRLGAMMDYGRQGARSGVEAKLAPEYRPKCLSQIEQLLARGWIICKLGHATGNVNFGSFTVPAAIFTWGMMHSAASYYVHTERGDFNIQGPGGAPVGPAEPGAAPLPTTSVPERGLDSLEQKLLTLTRLRDAGAITQQEFETRRAKLLQQLE